MPNNPRVPWRFGEVYEVTDFIMNKNPAIQDQAKALLAGGSAGDAFVDAVASWIRDEFYYPLDSSGNPSASGQLLRHRRGIFSGYHFEKSSYYCWSLPNEVLAAGCGICIDTANLAASVLIAGGLQAVWVCLGDIRSVPDGTLLGRHAWVELPYAGATHVLETTICKETANNLVKAGPVYHKASAWAYNAELYYILQGKYNKEEFFGDGPLGAQAVELMGFPAGMMQRYGLEATLRNPTRMRRAWHREELQKDRLIRRAYREG